MRRLLAFVSLLIFFAAPAAAIDIKEVVSPKGIKAWLVEDRTIPLIAVNFSFEPGAAADPEGKEGLSTFLSAMLDEGAGGLDSEAYMARRDELGMKMSFDSGLDFFEGSFQTLSRNRDAAFAHLRLALTAPRFDAQPFERIKGQLLLNAEQNTEDPDRIASRAFMEEVMAGHAYARDSEGTAASIGRLTREDLVALHARLFTRKGLTISVVGDIDAQTLAALLDATFGGLPDTAVETVPDAPPPVSAGIKIISRDIPQSIITFGKAGLKRDDPEFIPAFVATYIVGGGSFGTRLTEELRVKRGLTYGVGYGLVPLDHAGLLVGSVGTRNEKAAEALDVIHDVLKDYAANGPTQKELDEAITYLTGSYPLRFDQNNKIAGALLGLQQEDLGLDYVNTRNARISAVTLDQVKAQAKRLFGPEGLQIVIVGKPEGVKATQ